MPPLLWSNAQGADTTRPMTDATDAVDTSLAFSSVSPLHNTPVLWSGANRAEVSPPNSLYSLCGGQQNSATQQ